MCPYICAQRIFILTCCVSARGVIFCLFVCLFHRVLCCSFVLSLFCCSNTIRSTYANLLPTILHTECIDVLIFLYSPRFIRHSKLFSIKHCVYLYAELSEFAHTRDHLVPFFSWDKLRWFHLESKNFLVNWTSQFVQKVFWWRPISKQLWVRGLGKKITDFSVLPLSLALYLFFLLLERPFMELPDY